MNEKRNSSAKYKSGPTALESDYHNLIEMLASLEYRATKCGSFALRQEIYKLKRAIVRNMPTKKSLRRMMAQYDVLAEQVIESERAKKRQR